MKMINANANSVRGKLYVLTNKVKLREKSAI